MIPHTSTVYCISYGIIIGSMVMLGGGAMNFYTAEESELCLTTAGVPQGSVIAPLLYIVSINDLPSTASNCTIRMFCDDISLTTISYGMQYLPYLIDTLKNIGRWADRWFIKFSQDKSQYMLVTRSRRLKSIFNNTRNNMQLSLQGWNLQRVNHYK